MVPPQEPRRDIAIGSIVWGSILILIGVGWLLATLDIATIPWRAALAGVLIVIGVALLAVSAIRQPAEGLFTAGTVIAVLLALMSTASSAFSLPLSGGVGDRQLDPNINTLESEYNLVAGQLEINLGNVDFPIGETRIEVGVTFGRIHIYDIPNNVSVSIDAAVTAGELALLNSRFDGISVDQIEVDEGFTEAERRLVIEARVGFGQIEVNR